MATWNSLSGRLFHRRPRYRPFGCRRCHWVARVAWIPWFHTLSDASYPRWLPYSCRSQSACRDQNLLVLHWPVWDPCGWCSYRDNTLLPGQSRPHSSGLAPRWMALPTLTTTWSFLAGLHSLHTPSWCSIAALNPWRHPSDGWCLDVSGIWGSRLHLPAWAPWNHLSAAARCAWSLPARPYLHPGRDVPRRMHLSLAAT